MLVFRTYYVRIQIDTVVKFTDTCVISSDVPPLFTAITWSVLFNQEHLVYQTVCIEIRIKSTDQVLTSNQTQYLLKYSLDFVFSFVSVHWMIHRFRTIDYCFRFSFYPLTYVNFLHILDNEDRMSPKHRYLSALVFLIDSPTKVNLKVDFHCRVIFTCVRT